MKKMNLRSIGLAVALGLGSIAMVGCTTTPKGAEASGPTARAAIDREVDATLSRLYSTVPGTREMVQRAAGVLVFPSVVGGSFVVGAEYGKGALREGGTTTGYYSMTAGSIGFQAGGQSKAVVYVFNTGEALQKFKASNGWTAGVGGYALQQTTSDKQHGETLAHSKARAFAIGPSVKYDSGKGWFASLKWQKEVVAQNRPEGNAVWLKAVFPLSK